LAIDAQAFADERADRNQNDFQLLRVAAGDGLVRAEAGS
jgi:hypothetical protein